MNCGKEIESMLPAVTFCSPACSAAFTRGGGKTVPCETCGTPTLMTGTKRCDGCWEVEHRLADYIRRSSKSRDFVSSTLLAHFGARLMGRTDTTTPVMALGLTHDEIKIACKNVGVDLDCDACAEVFYTGAAMHEHKHGEKPAAIDDVAETIRVQGVLGALSDRRIIGAMTQRDSKLRLWALTLDDGAVVSFFADSIRVIKRAPGG
jgi:hypothetical protein